MKKIDTDHLEIYEAIKNNDFDTASDLMRKHSQYDAVFALKAFEQHNNL